MADGTSVVSDRWGTSAGPRALRERSQYASRLRLPAAAENRRNCSQVSPCAGRLPSGRGPNADRPFDEPTTSTARRVAAATWMTSHVDVGCGCPVSAHVVAVVPLREFSVSSPIACRLWLALQFAAHHAPGTVAPELRDRRTGCRRSPCRRRVAESCLPPAVACRRIASRVPCERRRAACHGVPVRARLPAARAEATVVLLAVRKLFAVRQPDLIGAAATHSVRVAARRSLRQRSPGVLAVFASGTVRVGARAAVWVVVSVLGWIVGRPSATACRNRRAAAARTPKRPYPNDRTNRVRDGRLRPPHGLTATPATRPAAGSHGRSWARGCPSCRPTRSAGAGWTAPD